MLLLKSAESIAGRLTRNEAGIVVADLPSAAQAILRQSVKDRFYYQIADSYGHRLTGDAVLPLPADTEQTGPKFRMIEVDGQPVRMCRMPIQITPSPDDIWIQVAETLDSRQRFLRHIFLSILVPQIMLIVLASLSVWLGVTHGLKPLDKLGRVLRSRAKVDLSPIDIGKTPKELAPVTNALNDVFSNANDLISSQRQFIGNAAHQLRTPLTALTTYLDYIGRLENSTDDEFDGVLKPLSEAVNRVTHLVNRLLSLARSEECGAKELEQVDLSAVVNEVGVNLAAFAISNGICMDFDLPETPVYIQADPGDIVELVTNLIDNAIKYTSRRGSVWVKLDQRNSQTVALIVEDDGRGIDDNEKMRIFERFYRIPGTDGPGCGLGLSIVFEAARSNAAQINVFDRPGGGTIFLVKFKTNNNEGSSLKKSEKKDRATVLEERSLERQV